MAMYHINLIRTHIFYSSQHGVSTLRSLLEEEERDLKKIVNQEAEEGMRTQVQENSLKDTMLRPVTGNRVTRQLEPDKVNRCHPDHGSSTKFTNPFFFT